MPPRGWEAPFRSRGGCSLAVDNEEDDGDGRRKPAPAANDDSSGERTPAPRPRGRTGAPGVGNALREAYQEALREEVPPEMLDLLGKLG